MMMVYDKKRTFRYNSFCNGDVLLLIVKPAVHTPYKPFITKVARVIRQLTCLHDGCFI